MSKIRGIFAALLLTLSLDSFAVCFHNQTFKSVYLYTVSDETLYDPIKIKPADIYCTTTDEEAKKAFTWIVTKTKPLKITADLQEVQICGAELRNLTVKDIYVVQQGEIKTCIGF